ncbi:MAG TPA: glycoside hydrolase family 13 protein, partial [Candidatus Wallbacteria bacterium]|nr:glycoside hydrolase family 13 protein [Candidatus Wallbacteria bacterium]
PTLGTEETFLGLLNQAHSKGIKLIIDGVFNHTSTDFFAFDDVKKLGEKSKYGAWYNFKNFPVNMQTPNYECWWNIGSLPKLNVKNTDVYNYLLTVPQYWMKTGIDGFRLDVPNELPHSFWKDFRKIVKACSKESYIVGEIWADGSPWLSGDQFDAVMNYKLRNQIISFFVKREITPLKLDEMLNENKAGLSESAFFSMMNMLDSHDTPRFLTVCGGDVSVFKSAIAFVMCYPGAPSIYYGDEIGLTGEKDPDNRKCMQWNEKEWNKDIYEFYKKIIAVRNGCLELRRGDIFTLAAEKDSKIYSFVRVYKNSATVCVFNQDDKNAGEFSVDADYILNLMDIVRDSVKKIKVTELYSGKEDKIELEKATSFKVSIPAKGFGIYKFFINEPDKR